MGERDLGGKDWEAAGATSLPVVKLPIIQS